jgi:hypothetical protein
MSSTQRFDLKILNGVGRPRLNRQPPQAWQGVGSSWTIVVANGNTENYLPFFISFIIISLLVYWDILGKQTV